MTHAPNDAQGSPITWTDAFALGFQPMDDVHHALVELLGKLQTARNEEVSALMAALREHLESHFAYENSLMISTEFPARDCHIDEHTAVMQSVVEVTGLLARGDFAVVGRLVQALVDWFPSHADHLDSALAHWMVKRKMGGKPVVIRRGLTLR
jgi:hemerythrin-like metal-binding protein